MDNKKLIVAITVALFMSKGANAAFTEEQRMADFNQLVNTIEKNYAPLLLKKETVGLEWGSHVSRYEVLVRNASSDKEFYHKIAGFMAGLQDSHVSIQVPADHRATLGFLSDYINGRVLIDSVNRKILPKLLFPFERGDRVISIGGVPVNKLMEELGKYSATGNAKSDKRFHAAELTIRNQRSGDIIPQGQVAVEIQPRGEDKIVRTNLVWIRSGRELVNASPVNVRPIIAHLASINAFVAEEERLSEESRPALSLEDLPLNNLSLSSERLDFLTKEMGLKNIGSSTPMFDLPEGTEVVLQTENILVGTYERQGQVIGLLRIASYSEEHSKLMSEITSALTYLEANVDVLVLDQTNNPGGNVLNVDAIEALFVENPTSDLFFAVRPTVSWMRNFEQSIQKINVSALENSTSAEDRIVFFQALLLRYNEFSKIIRSGLEDGDFLTQPFNITGGIGALLIPELMKVRFTKPVLLLINELCFSGGDVFPAFMKDNGRATLFGQQTAGAGGTVEPFGPLVYSELDFHLTTSLIFRSNGEHVENNGAKPDIEYSITEDDFMNGYKGYVEAFTGEALKLLEPISIAI